MAEELRSIYEEVQEAFPGYRIEVRYDKSYGYKIIVKIGLTGLKVDSAWWPRLNVVGMISEIKTKGKSNGYFNE